MPELKDVIYLVLTQATAFTSALRFDQLVTTLDAKTVDAAITFTRVTGLTEVRGSVVNVRLTADGTNAPNLSAFKMAMNSGNYDNRINAVNDLTFWYNGFDYWVAVTQPVGAVVIPPPDITAPVLQSLTLDTANFALIRATYNETLSSTSIPAIAAFTATGNTISSIAISGAIVSITLGTSLAAGASTTVAYAVPSSNKIQDTSGNPAIGFSQSVTRPSGADVTPPVLQSAVLNGSNFAQILLTYDEALNTTAPSVSAFAMTGQTISSISISGTVVTVTLTAVMAEGASGTLTYTVPGTNKIQDLAGNAAIAFSQTISRTVAARDWDFRNSQPLPPEFSTVGLSSSAPGTSGYAIATTVSDWGQGLVIGPVWNPDRVLSIYLVTPNSTTTKNYGGGISPEPLNWLNRTFPPNALIGIRGSIYYNNNNIKSYTTVSTNTRMRIDLIKEGADIRVQIYRWSGSAFVLATNGDILQVAGIAALPSAKIFVDAYRNDVIIERITN